MHSAMAGEKAGHVASVRAGELAPIPEETEKEWSKATPARGNKSGGRGTPMSSGRIKVLGATSGRLLPGEMRLRRMAPPSSAKRIKSKDAATVAAVAKKPKRSDNSVSSGEKRAAQDEQLPPTTEMETESLDAASVQTAKPKTKLSKSERALKKAEAALARAKAQVDADKISIKKSTRCETSARGKRVSAMPKR